MTDFGIKDNFVGVMKAVCLKINNRLNLVDITHQVTSQDILGAALLLKSSYRFFAPNSIFLTVVDPGVGSSRKALAIQTKNYFFVGPDNGILSLAACADGIKKIVELKNKKFFLKGVSHTFHGRDIFAPVAAYLSLGKGIDAFGKRQDSLKKIALPMPLVKKDQLIGEVVYIDKFGNLVTNIDEAQFNRFIGNNSAQLSIKGRHIKTLAKSYADVRPGRPVMIFGSFGLLEISLSYACAQKILGAKKGTVVSLSRDNFL